MALIWTYQSTDISSNFITSFTPHFVLNFQSSSGSSSSLTTLSVYCTNMWGKIPTSSNVPRIHSSSIWIASRIVLKWQEFLMKNSPSWIWSIVYAIYVSLASTTSAFPIYVTRINCSSKPYCDSCRTGCIPHNWHPPAQVEIWSIPKKKHVLLGNFQQTLDLWEMHQKFINFISNTCMG